MDSRRGKASCNKCQNYCSNKCKCSCHGKKKSSNVNVNMDVDVDASSIDLNKGDDCGCCDDIFDNCTILWVTARHSSYRWETFVCSRNICFLKCGYSLKYFVDETLIHVNWNEKKMVKHTYIWYYPSKSGVDTSSHGGELCFSHPIGINIIEFFDFDKTKAKTNIFF